MWYQICIQPGQSADQLAVASLLLLVRCAGALVRLTLIFNIAYADIIDRFDQFVNDLGVELATTSGLPPAAVRTTSVTAGEPVASATLAAIPFGAAWAAPPRHRDSEMLTQSTLSGKLYADVQGYVNLRPLACLCSPLDCMHNGTQH